MVKSTIYKRKKHLGQLKFFFRVSKFSSMFVMFGWRQWRMVTQKSTGAGFRGRKAPWWVEGNALVGGLGANGPQKLKPFLKNQVWKGAFSKPLYSFIDLYMNIFKKITWKKKNQKNFQPLKNEILFSRGLNGYYYISYIPNLTPSLQLILGGGPPAQSGQGVPDQFVTPLTV